MKKLTVFLMSILLIFAFTACSATNQKSSGSAQDADASSQEQVFDAPDSSDTSVPDAEISDKNTDGPADSSAPDGPAEKKVLVVYYSATGSTEKVANYIAEAAGADTLKLIPVNDYSSEDLNYNDPDSRVVYEHDHPEEREIELVKSSADNWDEYDTVFVGFPIWWHIAAWPVNGFVKANDFSGKTVIPFCTSASSGLEDSGKLLEEMAGSGNWLEGQRFSSGASEETVRDWVNGLGLQ